MKLRKIMTGIVASSLALSTLAVAASASSLKKVTEADGKSAGLSSGNDSWLVQVFNEGNAEENKPATKYDIDYSKVTGARFTVTIPEKDADGADGNREFWDGATGGGVILSINGGDIKQGTDLWDTYNWPSKQYWGVTDEALELATDPNKDDDASNDKDLSYEKIGDYTYQITGNGFDNPIANGAAKTIGCMQIALAEWGSSIATIEVVKCEVLDAEGNVLIAFDGLGNVVDGGNSAPATDAPATDAPATDAPATDAPATDAPTTGDSTKPSTNTGVESVAVVAGVAVLATGAVIVAKKRK